MDYKSKDLASVDLFEGERLPDQHEYDRMRKEMLSSKPQVIDNRTPEQKTAMLKELSKQDLLEYERILKTKNVADAGYNAGSAGKTMHAVLAKESFVDSKGRRIDVVYTSQGGISIQFYFLDNDRLGVMYDAITKKFGNNHLIPARYKRQIHIVSPLRSVCVFLPPQEFELGFKKELLRRIQELVK